MKNLLLFSPLFFLFACSEAPETTLQTNENTPNQEDYVVVNGDDTIRIPLKQNFVHLNPIPPRYQWEHNSGYCGEVSLISAGLYYGQYLSQYDVREIICGAGNQNSCQMLLGTNDADGAKKLRFNYETKLSEDSRDFLNWVKNHVLQGHPVIIGVMNNEYQLYGSTNPNAGQPDYDHIVPVVGIGSSHSLSDKYDENDVLLFSDNGLITVNGENPAVPAKGNVVYYYDYSFKDFVGSRQMANLPKGHPYTLIDLPKYKQGNKICDYAIAITGVAGQEETLPVRLTTNLNYEAPYIAHKSNKRPDSMALQLNVKVSGLVPGTKYCLYQYDNENDVPYKDFIKNSKNYKKKTEINISAGSEYTVTLGIMSNEKVFFRCVKAE